MLLLSMLMLVHCRLGIELVPDGVVWQENENIITPSGFYRVSDDRLLLIDWDDRVVKQVDAQGNILKVYGRKGMGPGETQAPAAIGVLDGQVHIYDSMTGKQVVYTMDGKFLKEYKLARGYAAIFQDNRIVVVAPFAPKFNVYDYEGNAIRAFGPGIENRIDVTPEKMIASLFMTAISGNTLFCVTRGGEKFYSYNLETGEELAEKDIDLHRFKAELTVDVEEGEGRKTSKMTSGMPVRDVTAIGEYLLVYCVDETRPGQAYFAVYDKQGDKVHQEPSQKCYKRMYAQGDLVTMVDYDFELVEQFRVRLSEN